MCAFVECLVGDVIRIENAKKKAQLFAMEGVQIIKFAFGKALCANVVSQDREDIGFVQSDSPWFTYMVSMEPKCHYLMKSDGGLLLSPLYVLVVSQK